MAAELDAVNGRQLSHAGCVQRVCCSSWSCTPHLADCPSLTDWSKPLPMELLRDDSTTTHTVLVRSRGRDLTLRVPR